MCSLFYFNTQASSLWQHLITLSNAGLADTISKLSDNRRFSKNVSYSHAFLIVIRDDEAYILAESIFIISCGVYAVAAIVAVAQSIDSLLSSVIIEYQLITCLMRWVWNFVVGVTALLADVSVNTILWSRIGFVNISIDSLLSSMLIGYQLIFCFVRWNVSYGLFVRVPA